MTSPPPLPLPLSGFRVLDLTRFLAGPYCTMVLADLGADVIKLEQPGTGDDSRAFGPFTAGESYTFIQANRGKRSVSLDLKDPRGRELARRLADRADLVVESFRPGVADSLGLGYAELSRDRPDLLYCSISGFGQTGPYAGRPGFDIMAQGVTGLMRMTGEPGPGSRPAKAGIAVNDVAAGTTAVYSILAAQLVRASTGAGQRIDVALTDALLAWTVWEAGMWFGDGTLAQPNGTRHRLSAPYQAYRTADGYVTIGANTDRLWRRTVAALDCPRWLSDPRFATAADRLAHVDELEAEIERVTVTRTTAEWVAALDAAGVPAGPVLRYDETLADPQVRAREMIVRMEHPIMGPVQTLGQPAKFSRSRTGPAGRRRGWASIPARCWPNSASATPRSTAWPRPGSSTTRIPSGATMAEPADDGAGAGPLLLDRDGPAAVVTISRPSRLNAVTFDMFARLPALLSEAAELPGIRALVLRGAGTRAFSAGADIGEFAAVRSNPEQAAAYDEAVLAAEEALAAFPMPTIAAVHGYCYGGGCGLALACDIRFAARAARFGITPAKLGLVYPLRSTKRLVDAVGPSRAKIILMAGAEYDADRALSFGLVDEVFDDAGALDAGVREFAALLASRSAVTQRAVKETVARILDGVSADDESHAALRAAAFASPDYAEGVRAFLERRSPRFG